MIKLFTMWTRPPELTQHEAVDIWLNDHAPLVAAGHSPTLLRYACNVGLPANYQGWGSDEAPAWDGVAESWYDLDDPAAIVQLIRTASREEKESERRFIGTLQRMVTDQAIHLDRQRPQRGIKMLFMLTRRQDMTPGQAERYWRDRHVPLVRATLGDALVRYTTNVGAPADFRNWSATEEPPYDGIATLAVDHDTEQQEAFIQQNAGVLFTDERAFMGTYRAVFTREELAIGSPHDALPGAILPQAFTLTGKPSRHCGDQENISNEPMTTPGTKRVQLMRRTSPQ